MQGVSESMAGRGAILQLLPFSLGETDRVSLLHGGYPEVLARPGGRGLWFRSYIQHGPVRMTVVHRASATAGPSRGWRRGWRPSCHRRAGRCGQAARRR
jgi:hypothetical protein